MEQYRIGSTGQGVSELQSLLRARGYATDAGGVYGAKTRSAVASYQRENGLVGNGVATEAMLRLLRGSTRTTSASNGYKSSGYYTSMGVDGLEDAYKATDAELLAQARAERSSAYKAKLGSLERESEEKAAGYNSELTALAGEYEKRARDIGESYDMSEEQLYNELNKRGLGRSSLVSSQGTYLQNQRNAALADAEGERAGAVAAINSKIALASKLAAEERRQLTDEYEGDVASRAAELKRDNADSLASLKLKLASLQLSGYKAYASALASGTGATGWNALSSVSQARASAYDPSDEELDPELLEHARQYVTEQRIREWAASTADRDS